MSAAALLSEAYRHGARIRAEGGRVIVEAPAPLPDALISELRRHKAEVLALLTTENHTNLTLDAEAVREAYEERAAIMEYEGCVSRAEAEREAWALVSKRIRLH